MKNYKAFKKKLKININLESGIMKNKMIKKLCNIFLFILFKKTSENTTLGKILLIISLINIFKIILKNVIL